MTPAIDFTLELPDARINMILDRLDNWERYTPLHPGFKAAFDYLRAHELAGVPDGKHAIDGDRLYASVEHCPGRGRGGARPEFHRKYIDIQCAISGVEVIGWKCLSASANLTQPYDPERDLGFYGDAPEFWMTLTPGTFAIFFPEDVHAPLAGEGPLHKVVMKIRSDR